MSGALKVSVTTPSDREIRIEREFKAPRTKVFDALTRPELVRQWLLGPPGWTMPFCEIDLRPGGSLRYVWRHPDKGDMGMRGTFQEVVPSERLVHTEVFDVDWTGGETVVTTSLREHAGRTTLTLDVLYASRDARDGALRSGMETGLEAGYELLEKLLAGAAKSSRDMLRHTVATLAYRAEKVLRDVPDSYPQFRASPSTRTPFQILVHLGDLMEWAERMARGERRWQHVASKDWAEARSRFFRGLAALDAALSTGPTESMSEEAIFQGPVADALTHVGQLALLRGMAGAPVRPESYARADIHSGVVGPEQSELRTEFDGDASG
ncbi:MAG: SRPBCC family protein [Longimicrobiales bacterium]